MMISSLTLFWYWKKMMQSQGLIVIRCINHLHTVSNNNNNTRRGGGILTINAWNTETIEGESTNSFECEANKELHRYFLLQEPIAVLLLIDKQAKWNQELENVYLISCEHIENNCQHYKYELRPDDGCLWHIASKCLSYLCCRDNYFWRHKSFFTMALNCSIIRLFTFDIHNSFMHFCCVHCRCRHYYYSWILLYFHYFCSLSFLLFRNIDSHIP